MTERKPPGTSWETWIEAQIRVAREQGAFDNLPGAGKPLPDLGACRLEASNAALPISTSPGTSPHQWPQQRFAATRPRREQQDGSRPV